MPTAEKVAKGGFGVGLGEVIEKGSMFLRNLILARMLAPADFGIGATFVTTYLLFMMISSFSTNHYLIQNDAGDEESLQKSVHTLELLRGVVSSIALFLTAGWIASFFGVPEAKWAFQLLGLIPLMLGLVHTDIFRFQRRMDFKPNIYTSIASDFLALLASYPAALYWEDYTAPLVCMLIKILSYTVLSHLLARRIFKLGWSWFHIKGLWNFGWPLLINGGLVYITLQGDRMIIGAGKQLFENSLFTLADLGAFSVAFSFTWIPTVMSIRVVTKVLLPYLSRVKHDSSLLGFRLSIFFPFAALYSIGISVAFILGGGLIITIFCGEEYLVSNYLIIWLAAANAVRIFRSLIGIFLLVKADTRNFLNCHIIGSLSFFASLAISASGLYLHWIGFAIFIAEIMSLMFNMYWVKTKHAIPLRDSYPYILMLAVVIPSLIAVNHFIGPFDGLLFTRFFLAAAFMLAATGCIWYLVGRTYRKNIVQMFRNLKNDIRMGI